MKIGLILAIEAEALFNYYKNPILLTEHKAFKVFKIEKNNNEIYVLQTGLGECLASAGTQYLISNCDVSLIINFGVVGGLTKQMSTRRLCVVDKVVHYRYDATEFLPLQLGQVDGYDSIYIKTNANLVEKALSIEPSLFKATCCSGDRFVGKKDDKIDLHNKFKGDICDMESAGIVLISNQNNIPCLILKAVSDCLGGGANEFYEKLTIAATDCLKLADKIIETL